VKARPGAQGPDDSNRLLGDGRVQMETGMKVLLVSMPDRHPYFVYREYEAPSLGLSSIAGNLDRRHEVWIADLSVRYWRVRSSVVACIRKYKPAIVGLSAMMFQYATARRIARLVKKLSPGTLVALGGYHATTMWRELADSPEAEVLDFIVRGEGDHAFGELLDALEGRRAIESVAGLSWKRGGAFRHNPDRPLEDLSTIALPDRDRRVFGYYHHYFQKADVMETSRGCFHRCNFCSMNQMYGPTFRRYTVDRVLDDVRDIWRRRGARRVGHVLIADDNITLDVPRFMDICDGLAGLKLPIQYLVQASCAGIAKDPALARKMAAAGVSMVFLGIENASEENLALMKKGKIVGVSKTAVRRLNDEGIIVVAGLINGFPNDDVAAIRRNYEYFVSLGIANVLDLFITPYPGTEIRRELLDAGLITNLYDYRWYNGAWPQVRTRHLTAKQLMWEKWKAKREIVGDFRANDQFKRQRPGFAYLWNWVIRPMIRFNERRMDFMYGEVGRYQRQVRQWLRVNDFFGDQVVDWRFFDPTVEGPDGIGNPAAALDGGHAPCKDTSDDELFVRTVASAPRATGEPAGGAQGPVR
jgi:anaerobic magnesium-protoporphyrin IX monomethyl ester cyclase